MARQKRDMTDVAGGGNEIDTKMATEKAITWRVKEASEYCR
jgi:hypothetical protein